MLLLFTIIIESSLPTLYIECDISDNAWKSASNFYSLYTVYGRSPIFQVKSDNGLNYGALIIPKGTLYNSNKEWSWLAFGMNKWCNTYESFEDLTSFPSKPYYLECSINNISGKLGGSEAVEWKIGCTGEVSNDYYNGSNAKIMAKKINPSCEEGYAARIWNDQNNWVTCDTVINDGYIINDGNKREVVDKECYFTKGSNSGEIKCYINDGNDSNVNKLIECNDGEECTTIPGSPGYYIHGMASGLTNALIHCESNGNCNPITITVSATQAEG